MPWGGGGTPESGSGLPEEDDDEDEEEDDEDEDDALLPEEPDDDDDVPSDPSMTGSSPFTSLPLESPSSRASITSASAPVSVLHPTAKVVATTPHETHRHKRATISA